MAASELPALPPIDPDLGVHPLFLSIRRADAIYVKVILESYEGLGVTRTEQPHYEEDRALIVFLLVPDLADQARCLLSALRVEIDLRFPPLSDGASRGRSGWSSHSELHHNGAGRRKRKSRHYLYASDDRNRGAALHL